MYNNLYNKLKTILKDISYLETIYNSNNIFNTDWFNIINLMEELGYKIINMYTFIKKKHIAQKYNLNFTNIFNMIKINFNRLSYIIVLLNITKDNHDANENDDIDTFFNKENFKYYTDFLYKEIPKVNNKLIIISSRFTIKKILFKKKIILIMII